MIFAAVTIMIFSPLQEKSGKAALGQGIGTVIAAAVGGILKFAVLPNHESLPGLFSNHCSRARASRRSIDYTFLAPYFCRPSSNFVPLLTPTNRMTYNSLAYYNSASWSFGWMRGWRDWCSYLFPLCPSDCDRSVSSIFYSGLEASRHCDGATGRLANGKAASMQDWPLCRRRRSRCNDHTLLRHIGRMAARSPATALATGPHRCRNF